MKKNLWIVVACLCFLFDRVIKSLFVEGIWSDRQLTDWFGLNLKLNSGLAFGLGAGWGLTISILGTIIFLYFIWYYYRVWIANSYGQMAIGLVLAGALSNLIDRLFYKGMVIDYLNLRFYSVFNLADVFIVVGLVVLIILFWRE